MVRHAGAAFNHYCPMCMYVGTTTTLVPPLKSTVAFKGGGYFLVGRIDFYIRNDRPSGERLYIGRNGAQPSEYIMRDAATIDGWSLVDLVRSDDGDDGEYMRTCLKSIRVIDRMDRMQQGYAVIRLADKPTSPFIITLPTLLPHEQEIAQRVAQPMVQSFQGNARNKSLMRNLDINIGHGLMEQANEHGYITRWNRGELFTPGESDECESPEFVQ